MKTIPAIRRQPSLRRAALALAAAGLMSLAGCTGGSKPIVTETPSATKSVAPSASPSASPTPLTDAELLALMPPEAAFPDVRGAIATAEFFTDQYAVMFHSGDSRVIEALSGPECMFCAEAVSRAANQVAAAQFESGGEITCDAAKARANVHPGDGFTYVDFSFVQSPTILHLADGSSAVTDAGSSGRAYFRMGLVSGVWRVIGVEVETNA